LSPAKRRRTVERVVGDLHVPERRVCRALGQPRSTQRYRVRVGEEESRLARDIVRLASRYGRYGYRRVTELLRREGWRVNHKRVERIWRAEGLKVPKRQKPRRRLWLNDGSCVRLRPERKNHVWSYDFQNGRTSDGRLLRFLNILDEYTRECLAMDVARSLTSEDVLDRLADLFVSRGVPEHIRSDNGPEFTAQAVRRWLSRLDVKPAFIEPGSPWENGYIESFNGKFRDEFLNRELLDTLLEARVLTARWRQEYNTFRPHSSLNYRPPVPEAYEPLPLGPGPLHPQVAVAA
jgi:putative transposase